MVKSLSTSHGFVFSHDLILQRFLSEEAGMLYPEHCSSINDFTAISYHHFQVLIKAMLFDLEPTSRTDIAITAATARSKITEQEYILRLFEQ